MNYISLEPSEAKVTDSLSDFTAASIAGKSCLSEESQPIPLTVKLLLGDMLEQTKQFPDNYFDIIVTSPPYEDCRDYGTGFKLKKHDWVDWAFERYLECNRVCKGLVAWVVQGKTSRFRWSATPAHLMSKLDLAGIKLRLPPLYKRWGVPGSGGNDFWRNRYEFILCSSKGKLPYAKPTATGHPPKFKVGGNCSHRKRNGIRVNQAFRQPKIANPGNILECSSGHLGKGKRQGHQNEAPFPYKIPHDFLKCFCPPGGIVYDPFCGSGTTGQAAADLGINFVGCDIRESQIQLTKERLNVRQ